MMRDWKIILFGEIQTFLQVNHLKINMQQVVGKEMVWWPLLQVDLSTNVEWKQKMLEVSVGRAAAMEAETVNISGKWKDNVFNL